MRAERGEASSNVFQRDDFGAAPQPEEGPGRRPGGGQVEKGRQSVRCQPTPILVLQVSLFYIFIRLHTFIHELGAVCLQIQSSTSKSEHIINFRSLELSIREGLKDPNLEYFEVFRALAKDSARRSTGNLHENNNVSNTEGNVGLVGN